MTENIIFSFSVDKAKNTKDVFDYVKLCKFGETCLDSAGIIPNHIQESFEICYIVSGTGELVSNKKEYPLNPGDVFVVSSGVGHIIKSNENSRMRFIHFSFEFMPQAPEKLVEFYKFAECLILKDEMKIGVLLNMLIDEFYYEKELSSGMREYIIKMIVISVFRNSAQKEEKYSPVISEEKKKTVVYSVMKYIEQNRLESENVGEIAKKFSYAPNYLSHLFKKYTGMSLKEYQMTAKMEKARELVEDGKLSLREVAEMCGYDSVPSFCRMYKKYITLNEGGKK